MRYVRSARRPLDGLSAGLADSESEYMLQAVSRAATIVRRTRPFQLHPSNGGRLARSCVQE